jgi:hypothetical protein
VYALGWHASEVDLPIHQQLTDAERRAIVDVAGIADPCSRRPLPQQAASWPRFAAKFGATFVV